MLSTLSQLVSDFGNNVEFLLGIVINTFWSLTFMGELLIHGIALVASSIKTVLLYLVNGFSIVFSEFFFFLRDIADFKDELFHLLVAGFTKCSDSVIAVLNSIQNFSCCVYSAIWGIFDTAFQIVSSVFLFINSFLHLIGQSFIVLLHAIFFDSSTLAIDILCTVKSLVVHVLGSIWNVLSNSLNIVFSTVLLFKSMPITSCLGLLVVIASFMLGKMFSSQITRAAKSVSLCMYATAGQLFREVRHFAYHCLVYLRRGKHTSPVHVLENTKSVTNPEDLLRQLEMEREEKLCVICRDRMKMFVLLPCRHYCLCQTCLDAILLRHASCPICRHYVYDSWKIFS